MRESLRNTMAWLFVLLQVVFAPFAQLNHNTSSRLAAMAAFCAHGSFEITEYRSWTDDWARTPDGRYYSNKAPGGIVLGAPVFCALESVQHALSGAPDESARVERDWKLRYVANLALCLLLQILPWVLLCEAWDFRFKHWGVPTEARTFASVAFYFGTTAAILQDVWMGHALTALLALWALLALIEKRSVLLGLLLGMAILTDYSAAVLLPAALLAMRPEQRKPRELGWIALGAAAPALVWVAYHQACFGHPLAIANRFQNPMFQDKLGERIQLWGVLGLPDSRILLELLFGWKRGLLFSQPWILVACAAPFFARARFDLRAKIAWLFVGSSFLPLLAMNASFGGWHGGASTGPRYLSASLPLFGAAMALSWEAFPRTLQRIAWGTLAFACVVFALGKVIGPTVGLWPEFLTQLGERRFEILWKSALFAILAGPGAFLLARRSLAGVNPPRL